MKGKKMSLRVWIVECILHSFCCFALLVLF